MAKTIKIASSKGPGRTPEAKTPSDEEVDEDEESGTITAKEVSSEIQATPKAPTVPDQATVGVIEERPAGPTSIADDSYDVNDIIIFTMFETVEPAPRVGNIDLVTQYGIAKLEQGRKYRLPYGVAAVLIDRKLGSITNG